MKRRQVAVLRRPGILTRRWTRQAKAHGPAFWLIVVNGVLASIANTMLQTGGVVAGFLTRLTGSASAVGVAVGFGVALWQTPQFLVSQVCARRTRRMPLYRFAAHGTWMSLAFATALVLVMAERPKQLAVAFIAAFCFYYIISSFANVPFQDILARTIPPGRRGRLWGLRIALGGLVSFGLGFFVRWVLGAASPVHFPQNYALLFGIGLVTMMVGQSLFMRVDEPEAEAEATDGKTSLRELLALARGYLSRDANLRQYMRFRIYNAGAFAPVQFLVPCAMMVLGVDDSVVGTMISLGVLASVLATWFWSRISDRLGNKRVLLCTLSFRSAALASAALAMVLHHNVPVALWLLILARCLSDIALAGMVVGNQAYVAEMCDERDLPYYIGLVNSLSGPVVVFTPMLVGFLAPVIGYLPVFLIGTAASMLCVFTIHGMVEPRESRSVPIPHDLAAG